MSNKQKDYYNIDGYNIPKLPLLSNEEELRLIKEYKSGNRESGKKVIEHNYGLVVKSCYRILNDRVPKIELFQEGCLGLMDALEKFDIEKGNKYSTVAVWWIKKRIFHYCTRNAYKINVGQRIYQLMYKIRAFESMLTIKLGREPTLEEISKELGVSIDRIIEAKLICSDADSLDKNVIDSDNAETNTKLYDILPGMLEDPEEIFFKKNRKEAILEIINEVCKNDIERKIIFDRFGFNDEDNVKTLKELGLEYNISSERVRQIEAKVLRKIKKKYFKQLKTLL